MAAGVDWAETRVQAKVLTQKGSVWLQATKSKFSGQNIISHFHDTYTCTSSNSQTNSQYTHGIADKLMTLLAAGPTADRM